jgi:type IV secretion system protein VirB8
MTADPRLEQYLGEAASWDADARAQSARAARIAWRVAAGASLCALASAAALVLLMPLKRVEPFLIRVDDTTGAVAVVPAYRGHATFSQAVTRYFLAHYITVCERFDFVMAPSDYQQCGAFNSARLNEALYARWNRANPRSPLNVHKDGSTVTVRIESISLFARTPGQPRLAQVRYASVTRHADGTPGTVSHWIASIEYTWSKPPSDPLTREWNPLGFEVLDLRLEPEVLAPVPVR